IVKNYAGDIMNFEMAKEIAEMEEIAVEMVVVDDDIAVEDSTYTQGKRGVAGTILVHKILGAAAREGKSLSELVVLAEELIPAIHTIGVALSGATVPEVGKPGFLLEEDELEFGVGIHGEPGYSKQKMLTSNEIVEEMLTRLEAVTPLTKDKQYAVLVNGLGSTPLMEQYVFFNDVANQLGAKEVEIVFSKVGDLMTAIDMAGVSLTLLEIKSADWLDYLNQPVTTVAW
ncbi:MAG: dihydroxyacetone kinase subunit DhaK, partial [Enterococcus sp.]|nr:dihydroxyacetone kinase subunit DhaK [Enterococcus sp.]